MGEHERRRVGLGAAHVDAVHAHPVDVDDVLGKLVERGLAIGRSDGFELVERPLDLFLQRQIVFDDFGDSDSLLYPMVVRDGRFSSPE